MLARRSPTRSPTQFFRLVGLILLLAIGLALPGSARASVTLVSYDVIQEDAWARLDWETASELDNAGFFILRNTTGGTQPQNYTMIPVTDVVTGVTDTYIAPRGNLIGALYAFYDQNVTPGTEYFYLLQAVDSNNQSEYFGPESVLITGEGSPSATPTSTNTLTPTFTPSLTVSAPVTTTVTVTPTPTRTPTRTLTPTPTRTTTPVPTFPPFNTVTPTRTQTPTPGPSFTPTLVPTVTLSPTITPSPSVTMHPLDLTLTAVIGQITPLPTYTPPNPTRTPFPTWTPTLTPSAIPLTPGFFDGVSSTGLLGLIFAGGLTVAGGGFLTFFLLYLRKK